MYRAAQTTTLLGGGGKGEERKADLVKCPKTFVPHCRLASATCGHVQFVNNTY